MQLLALTPAEINFLTAPGAAPDSLGVRLTSKLAATLTARLRLPVQAQIRPQAVVTSLDAPLTPRWQPDPALATLWLTRRLGGQRVTGTAPFVPRGLLQALDQILAECWLDQAANIAPPALTWQLVTDLTQATLTVHLPQHPTDITRWARGVIQHG